MIDTYYINSNSFLTATSIYTDAALTTFAPDGFYKDCGVVRQLVSGVLSEPIACPTCAAACDANYAMPNQGVYTTTVDLGPVTGVSSVLFNPGAYPAAIYVTYNGTTYSAAVQSNGTTLDGPYFGDSANDCGLVTNSPHLFNAYTYSAFEGAYEQAGTSQVNITADQLSLTSGDPGTLYIVFAYNDSSVTQATITVVNACKDSSSSFSILCGDRMASFDSTTNNGDPASACAAPLTSRYYLSPRDGVSIAPSTGDKVYLDAGGRIPLEDGFYGANIGGVKKSFEVVTGAVQTIAACAAP
jgi:hypothetical protein